MRLLRKTNRQLSIAQHGPNKRLGVIKVKLSKPVILLLATSSFIFISWHYGLVNQVKVASYSFLIKASIQSGFVVDDISLIGRVNTKRGEIIGATKVTPGQSILEINPKKIQSSIAKLPWVEFAIVQRYLPNKLVIRISERQPIAIWQKDANLALIDHKGHLIKVSDLSPFRRLPTLVGKDAPVEASKLINLLTTEPELSKLVVGATWIGGRRWNVNLRGGIKILLPEIEPRQAWKLLAGLHEKYTLLARDINIIDLRLPDRVIVKMGPHGRQLIRKAGKNT